MSLLTRIKNMNKPKELTPLVNVMDVNGFAFELDTVRANVFEILDPHTHPDEDGAMLFMKNSHAAYDKNELRVVQAGELIAFGIGDTHGFIGNSKVVVFHGYVPFEQASNYEIVKVEYVDHPQGGQGIVVYYNVNGMPQEPLSYTPSSNMTLGAILRNLDIEIRKSRGEDVNAIGG